MEGKDFDTDLPLGITQRELPIKQDIPDLDGGDPFDPSKIGEITKVPDDKLAKEQLRLTNEGYQWTAFKVDDSNVVVFTRDITKCSDAIGLRSRSLGVVEPTLSCNEWDRLLVGYNVEDSKREAFIKRMVKKSGDKTRPFDAVEALLGIAPNRAFLVCSNMSLVTMLTNEFNESSDRIHALLIDAAGSWDKDEHPAFRTYAYSKIKNAVKNDRRR